MNIDIKTTDLKSIWEDVARRHALLPEIDAMADDDHWDEVRAKLDAGNDLLRYLAETYGAVIDLNPDDTRLSLCGVTIREAYGAPGVVYDWLRKTAPKIGINFYESRLWQGPRSLDQHDKLCRFVAVHGRI